MTIRSKYVDWTPAIADEIALEEGVGPLTSTQWTVALACRETGTADPKVISRVTGIEIRELDRLFANSFRRVAARIAGLDTNERNHR